MFVPAKWAEVVFTLVSPVFQGRNGLLVSWRLHALELLPVSSVELTEGIFRLHAERSGGRP